MYRTVEMLIRGKDRQPPVSVTPQVLVDYAVRKMNEHNIGSVLVMDGERLLGIFTERDVLRRIVGAGVDPRSTSVEQVMTRNPHTITPSLTVQEVAATFESKGCRHLPVIVNGKVRAMISLRDISRCIAEELRIETEQLKSYIAG
jgi:CBS domain-containing protein